MEKKIYSLINKGKNLNVTHIVDNIFTFEGEIEVSDGYHTMEELYDHRRALTILLTKVIMKNVYNVLTCLRSKLHHDGTMFDGYFVVVIYAPFKPGQQVSYHYKLEHWDEFEHCITQDKISIEYDGHTSLDVIKRLENFEVAMG